MFQQQKSHQLRDQAFIKAIDNLITQLTDAKNKANKPTGGPTPVAEAEPAAAPAPTPPVAATPTPVAGPPLQGKLSKYRNKYNNTYQ